MKLIYTKTRELYEEKEIKQTHKITISFHEDFSVSDTNVEMVIKKTKEFLTQLCDVDINKIVNVEQGDE